MVLKRKKKREYYKDLRTVSGVFDEHTVLLLYRLLNTTGISAESLVKEGKESVVLSGLTSENKWVAIKVYRTDVFDFKTMWKYLVGDYRFKRTKKSRKSVVSIWCQREFKNLKIARKGGVDCPEPIVSKGNVLIMSFIGKDGICAPRLIDVKPENPKKVYKKTLENMEKLAKMGLIHGDLSAYNVLFLDKPYLIDLSHSTTTKNPLAKELLKRDVKNINAYFSKFNFALNDPEKVFEKLLKITKEKGV